MLIPLPSVLIVVSKRLFPTLLILYDPARRTEVKKKAKKGAGLFDTHAEGTREERQGTEQEEANSPKR